VDASVIESRGAHELRSSKVREVRVPRPLMAALVDDVDRHGFGSGEAIYQGANGGLCRYLWWQKFVWRIAREATTLVRDPGSPDPAHRRGARTHDLRSTYISFLFSAGATVPGDQAIVGHADSAVTLEVYATVQREEHVDRDAVTLRGAPLSIEERLDRLWDLHRARYGHAVGRQPVSLRVVGK
jgi:integrase